MSDDPTKAGDDTPHDAPPDASVLAELETLGHLAPSIQLRPEGATDAPMPEIVVRKGAERYEIVGEIARGGVGIVLQGRDRDIGRDVAMKVLRDEHRERTEVVERFIEEAQIGGQLQHPGIVPIYELGLHTDERPFFTMKLVKGQTLAALLADRDAEHGDERRFLKIFESVCQTVAYAHSRGVIHRDLKPANIMVGAFGEVQVVDWGLAKVLAAGGVADERRARQRAAEQTIVATVRSESDGSDSIDGTILGTPAYMPPEQALGQVDDLDERADVFALGGILCEILTGAPPYVADETAVVVKAVRSDLSDAYARLDDCTADDELIELARSSMSALRTGRPRDAGVLSERIAAHNASVEERAHRSAVALAEAEAETARSEREAAEERTRAQLARQSAKAAQARAEHASRLRTQTRAIGYAVAGLIAIGIGAWMWVRSDKAAVRRQAQEGVETALAEASFHEAKEDWVPAVAAARKAMEMAATGGASFVVSRQAQETHDRLAAIQQRVDQARRRDERDRALVERLEQVRALALDSISTREWDRQFSLAFQEHGLDAGLDDLPEFARLIRASPLGATIATFLDEWALLRRDALRMPEDEWRPLVNAAREIDADPWRNRLRRAIVGRHLRELQEMALQSGRHDQGAATMALLSHALASNGDRKRAVQVLAEAQRRLAGDVWLAVHLARHHARTDPANWSEAARYYTVARALHPQSAPIRTALAIALRHLGQTEAAIAELREAVRVQPGLAYAQNALGELVLSTEGAEAALPYVRKALAKDPSLPQAYAVLSDILRQMGKLKEAKQAAEKSIKLDRQLVQGHENLVLVLAEVDDLDGALAAAEEAGRQAAAQQTAAKTRGDPLKEGAGLRHLRGKLGKRARSAQLGRVLAHGLERDGRWEDARDAWRAALDANPRDALAKKRLASILVLAPDPALHDLPEAERLAGELLGVQASHPGGLLIRGMARLGLGDGAAAEASFRDVLALKTGGLYYKPFAQYALALAHAAQEGGGERALDHFQQGEKARGVRRTVDPLLEALRKRADAAVQPFRTK